MKFTFHPAARIELDKAADYYESIDKGLGIGFSDEVYEAIQRILSFPDAWPMISRRARRCLTNRFPYGIIYQTTSKNNIRIIAVAHLHRRPNYWTKRLV